MTRFWDGLIVQVGRSNGVLHCWLKTLKEVLLIQRLNGFMDLLIIL